MKYTRLEIYKGISNSKLKTMLCFFIVLPLIAVISGSIITRILIPNDRAIDIAQFEDKQAVVASTSTTIDYKVFFLQAGAFMSKNNADILKTAIKRDDIDPVVIEDKDIYRVIINLSDNKELLIQNKDKLSTLGYNCLLNEFTFFYNKDALNEEIEKINEFVKISTDIVESQINLNDDFAMMDIDKLSILKKYIANLNDNYTELEKLNSTSTLKNFKNSFEGLANEYIKSYEARDLNTCKKISGQQVLLLNNYYKEVFQTNIK